MVGGITRKKLRFGGAALILMLLAAMPASTSYKKIVETAMNERCVMCHPGVFNVGMDQKYRHDPFLERHCATCHVDKSAPDQKEDDPAPEVTGVVVDQEPLWSRRYVIPAGSEKDTDHLAVLEGLSQTRNYRIRFFLNKEAPGQEKGATRSPWLGLAPGEVSRCVIQEPHTMVSDVADKTAGMVSQLILFGSEPTSIFVAWQTPEEGYSWVELQELPDRDQDGLTDSRHPVTLAARAGGKGHPRLKDPHDLTITICFSCHPQSSLGATHPIGVQALAGSSEIPDDLPTAADHTMTCITCHGPHGGSCRSLVRDKVENELCGACHLKDRKKVVLNTSSL